MCSSTTFSSSRRRLQRAKPSGAGESVSAISFASAAPSKMRGRAELGLYLRVNTASNPSSTSWRLVRSILAMLVSSAAAIRLSLHPSPAFDTSAFKRMRAFVSSRAERLPSRKIERATYHLVAFRFIAVNDHPDRDTIATFRRRFRTQIEGLFVQVLSLAREMGVLKLGTVEFDGTKIDANASQHSGRSDGGGRSVRSRRYSQWLCAALEKVRGEWSLVTMAWNIKCLFT